MQNKPTQGLYGPSIFDIDTKNIVLNMESAIQMFVNNKGEDRIQIKKSSLPVKAAISSPGKNIQFKRKVLSSSSSSSLLSSSSSSSPSNGNGLHCNVGGAINEVNEDEHLDHVDGDFVPNFKRGKRGGK